jgi:hypothetical protein
MLFGPERNTNNHSGTFPTARLRRKDGADGAALMRLVSTADSRSVELTDVLDHFR